ncbi:MAG: RNA polymerase sigma factor [Saprospiraceae bacterium]
MNIDATLLQACQKNDRKAQSQLYKSCFGLLMSVCIRYKKDEAEARAILNQGFLKILTNLNKYDPKIPFEAWIRRIMINTIIDEFRKYKKHKERTQYTDFTATDTFNDKVDFNTADQMFDAADVEYFIKQLPPVSQQVFNLFIVDGYSHKEIGKMLEITEGTSKWHLSSARKRLKKMLKEAMEKERVRR